MGKRIFDGVNIVAFRVGVFFLGGWEERFVDLERIFY